MKEDEMTISQAYYRSIEFKRKLYNIMIPLSVITVFFNSANLIYRLNTPFLVKTITITIHDQPVPKTVDQDQVEFAYYELRNIRSWWNTNNKATVEDVRNSQEEYSKHYPIEIRKAAREFKP